MTPERWQQVKAVLAAAAALEPASRAAYLDAACGADAELRTEVESLLAFTPAEGDRFLDTPALGLDALSPPPSPQIVGRRIGPYEILGELGRGGMGEVYRAHRADGQYEQQVAIKLIRRGYEERGVVLERFRTERQILASLDHPNIARLLDGGATEDGSPYFVMELIEGSGICDYCDARRLDITARLELFRHVCSAVQYAHQRLIVHRDIKPRNILVTGDGVPKLLDFGVAKILAPASDVEATAHGPMTLAYASPEQVRGDPVTTASDVYSLGVVLYQLLSGRSPYRRDTRTPGGLYRAIDEDEPVRPSAAVGQRDAVSIDGKDVEPTAETLSATREGSVARLTRRLGGDLDDIVLKALRKEPAQRYASVEHLSDDIARHLGGFPVRARQGTWTYHARKFVRRHRVGMATAAAVAVLTVAGVAATVREARIAAANARRAEQRFEQVRKLANAMVFDLHDAVETLPGATKPRELIVRLGLEYLDQLSRDAGADASLQMQVAAGYVRLGRAQGDPGEANLGDPAGAAASYRKAIEILDRLRASRPADRDIIVQLAEALSRLTRVIDSPSDRWAVQRRSLDLRRSDAEAHPDDLPAQRRLAIALYDSGESFNNDRRYAEAAAPFQQALAIFQEADRRAPSADADRNVALCEKKLAALRLRAGDLAGALAGYQAARAIDERLAADDPRSLQARTDLSYDLSDMGTTLRRMNRWDEADAAFTQAVGLRRDAYAVDKNNARARRSLAAILFRHAALVHYSLKKPRAAVPLLLEASQLWSVDGDHADPQRAEVEYELSIACDQLGNPREAQLHRATAIAVFSAASRRGALFAYQQQMLDELRRGARPASDGSR